MEVAGRRRCDHSTYLLGKFALPAHGPLSQSEWASTMVKRVSATVTLSVGSEEQFKML
jgi:hypothetical protein